MAPDNRPSRLLIPSETNPSSSALDSAAAAGPLSTAAFLKKRETSLSNYRNNSNTNTNNDSSSASASANDNDATPSPSTALSPPASAFGRGAGVGVGGGGGTETPPLVSPAYSMMVNHGSVFGGFGAAVAAGGFPFPKGMLNRHDQGRLSANLWERVGAHAHIHHGGLVSPHEVIHEHDAEEGQKADSVEYADENRGINETDHVGDSEAKAGEDEEVKMSNDQPAVHNERVIAIDFDDVCTQNMLAIITEHNEQYGTDLTLDDLETYVFWQNRGWGSPADVSRKVKTLNQILHKTLPVPGFASALRLLHSFGHPIHIVTSRPESDRQADVIAAAWFTGSYVSAYPNLEEKGDTEEAKQREKELNERLKALWKEGADKGKSGLAKLEILRKINASLFIDDHHGNIEPIINAQPPIPCLLFGTYGWNKASSGLSSPIAMMDYDQRMQFGLPLPFEEIPEGKDHGLHRTKGWEEVIRWVKEWDREAEGNVSA
ncbi:hypothetical protein CI109_101760 [Kwoniella shandongensis]|uniref:Uncharacterized protein n=1 Tax=Kwoniella shandongensis TaxID=1734106 RepID=A0A5M6C593_9TREE|nr:uncharacterized protein CI109_001118 [Kwoniella shandongensis]KAA5530317.1 hypothetical protein CI109_001118 [Kwoniella shandongensis]